MFDKLSVPKFGISAVLNTIDRETKRKSNTVKKLLQPSIKIYLAKCEDNYLSKGEQFYLLSPQNSLPGDMSREEITKMYTNRFRNIYKDKFPQMIHCLVCPICGSNITNTFDHVLPKSLFPEFAITPINLVPMCLNCNSKKSESLNTTYEQSSFHPYYEDFSDLTGLYFRLTNDQSNPVKIEFMEESNSKLKNIFHLYGMDTLLEMKSGILIRSIAKQLVDDCTKRSLELALSSCQKNLDSETWKKILYTSLLEQVDSLYKNIDWFQ